MKATMPHSNSHPDPELLSAYLDEEVGAAERASVQGHLAGCERCRHELDSLRWTASLFRQLPSIEPPRAFYVTEALLAPEPVPSLWERLVGQWRPLLGSLSATAALLLAVLLLQTPVFGPQMAAQEAAPAEQAVTLRSMEADEASAEMAQAPEAAQSSVEEAQAEAAGVAAESEDAEIAADAAAAEPVEEASRETEQESEAMLVPAPSPTPGAAATEVAIPPAGSDEATEAEAADAAEDTAPQPTTVAVEEAAPPTVAPEELPVAAGQEEAAAPAATSPTRLLGWAAVAMLLLLAAGLFFWRR